MKDKYYTPDISEFHVGFEYERQQQDANRYLSRGLLWHSHVYGLDSVRLHKLITMIDSGEIRVKYLDTDDIESLGFKWVGEPWSGYYGDDNIQIRCTDGRSEFTIHIRDLNKNQVCRFLGTIKNKSELKKILKQIGYETK